MSSLDHQCRKQQKLYPMPDSFFAEVDRLVASTSSPRDSAERLYGGLSDAEKLWLLDGDLSPLTWGLKVYREGYNEYPQEAAVIDRIDFPGVRFSDGPRGLNVGTAFPCSSTRAQSWDVELEEEIGVAMGRELRSIGGNYFGGVCVNLAPDPRWGRLQESYGEDPLLIGCLGSALARGVGQNAIACVKHFALNSMENMRFTTNVTVDEDILHECYLPHFRQILEEGRAESLMSAYNQVNGEYCGENAKLLNGVVRDVWGYDDVFITSDWIAGFRDAVKSVEAGLDLEMPYRSMRATHLSAALRKGTLSWKAVDRIGLRILRSYLKYYARIAGTSAPVRADTIRCGKHRQLAYRSATRSMVLLKNDGILPFTGMRKLLVIGELAVSKQTGDGGSSEVRDPGIVTPLEGLRGRSDISITYLDGSDHDAVKEGCADADAVLLLVGYTGMGEGEYIGSSVDPGTLSTILPGIFPYRFMETALRWTIGKLAPLYGFLAGKPVSEIGGDRKNLRLTVEHERLAKLVAEAAGNKLVLAIEASGPVILPPSVRKASRAILMTGYAGCQFGNALRDVLFGDAEPAGRLAYGIPESDADTAVIDMSARQVTYPRFWSYRLEQQAGTAPAFPFGFGLGYGTTTFSSMEISPISRFFSISVMVRNTGERSTSAVVQVYAGRLERGTTDYQCVLLGFTRSDLLAPGSEQTVEVQCRLDPLSHWNTSERVFRVVAGKYNVFAAQHEGDVSVKAEVDVPATEWSARTRLQ